MSRGLTCLSMLSPTILKPGKSGSICGGISARSCSGTSLALLSDKDEKLGEGIESQDEELITLDDEEEDISSENRGELDSLSSSTMINNCVH